MKNVSPFLATPADAALSNHAQYEIMREKINLTQVHDSFYRLTINKLHKKAEKGFTGWGQGEFKEKLLPMLKEHLERAENDPEQYIDIANFCMMLYAHENWAHDDEFFKEENK